MLTKQSSLLFPALSPVFIKTCKEHFASKHTVALLHSKNIELLDENEYHSILSCLTEQELTKLNGYVLPKRRNEFLAGRLSAKHVLMEFLHDAVEFNNQVAQLQQIEICNSQSGRPYFKSAYPALTSKQLDISISHSGEYGCSLAAERFCGIDIQQHAATLLKVQERYCSPTELTIICKIRPPLDSVLSQAILWTAKEALKKAINHGENNMPGFLDLHLTNFQEVGEHTAILHFLADLTSDIATPLSVVSHSFSNYTIAITIL